MPGPQAQGRSGYVGDTPHLGATPSFQGVPPICCSLKGLRLLILPSLWRGQTGSCVLPRPWGCQSSGYEESLFHISLSQGPQGEVQGGKLQLCLQCGLLVRRELTLWGSACPLGHVGGGQSALTVLGAHRRMPGGKWLTCLLSPSAPDSGYNLDVRSVQNLSIPHAGRHFGYRVLQVGNG